MISTDSTTASEQNASVYFLVSFQCSHHKQLSPTCAPVSHQRLKAYRLKLAEDLVRKKLGRPRSTVCVQPVTRPPPVTQPPPAPGTTPGSTPTGTVQHFPSRLQRRRRCVYCARERDPPLRREVCWQCKECPGQPPLCLTGTEDGSDCYRLWHEHM